MNVCHTRHEAICFSGHCCPLCELRNEFGEQIDSLNTTIDTLKEELRDQGSQLENLQRDYDRATGISSTE